MIARIALLLAIAIAIFFIMKSILAKKKVSVNQFMMLYGAVIALIIITFLAVTGRLHPIAAAIGVFLAAAARLLPLLFRSAQALRVLGMLGLFQKLKGASVHGGPSQQQQTEASSDFFNMILDHETGLMDGTVLIGSLAGKQLSTLPLNSLLSLLDEVTTDPESKMLLEAFLDRNHPDWRQSSEQAANATSSGPLTRQEALSILSLSGHPTKQEITQAHRVLMQKMHPDRGGSTYLAARINAAKDVLIAGL
jgi:hypothetical protein